jgi:hypothetical protein
MSDTFEYEYDPEKGSYEDYYNARRDPDTGLRKNSKATGNLEMANELNLTEVLPKDLIEGEKYLMYNQTSNSKTKATFVKKETITNDWSEEEELNDKGNKQYEFVFKDNKGTFKLFGDDFEFDENFKAFLSKHNMYENKVLGKVLPEDAVKKIQTYKGGKKITKRKRTTRRKKTTTKRRKRITRRKNYKGCGSKSSRV